MSIVQKLITSYKSQIQKTKAASYLLLVPLVLIFYFPAIAGIAGSSAPLKEITVVSDDNYPPFIFRDEKGHLQGTLVDEWRLWEEKTGIKVDLRGMDWDKAKKTMAEGNAQVIDTTFFTEERAKTLAFSAPYASLDVPIFFHRDISGIRDVKSLHGFTIGVKAGDACIDFLKGHGIFTLREYPSYESIVRDAAEQKIKVFCIDSPPAHYYLYKMNLEQQYRHTAPLYTGQFHRAVHKERKVLLTAVEEGFAKFSRKEHEEIEKRWRGSPIARTYLTYLFYLIGVLVILGAILMLWNHSLRRKVTQKTVQLQAAIDALGKSEKQYRLVVENADEAILIAQGGFLKYVNPITIKMLGYSEEVLTSMPFVELIHPEDREKLFEAHIRIMKGEENQPVQQFRVLTSDGTVRWADSRAVTISWEGKPATLNFISDITERMRAEEELRESEEKYRNILENIEDGYFEVDLAGNFTFFNPSLCRILGYPGEEMPSMNNRVYMDAENAKKIFQAFNKVYLTGIPQKGFEWETIRKDGTRTYLEVSVSLIASPGEKPTGFRGIARNVTERKRAEEALRQSEQHFRILYVQSPVAYQALDVEGRFLEVNEAWLRLLGYSCDEVVGRWFGDFIMPSQVHLLQERFSCFKSAGETRGVEWDLVRKDGNLVTVSIDGRIGRDETGAFKRTHCVLHDITERKRAEEALRASREQMRALAGRLQAVREEERTDIAREIHDELGGALTGMKVDVSFLIKSALKIKNEAARTSLLAGMDSVTKAIDTTIHAVRRIAMELRPGILDDLGLVAALEWQLKDFEKRTGIRCEFFPPGEDISFDADLSTALFRIFQETLTNVARHSGATEVHVRFHADADSSTLEVEDNGKGIEKEKTLSSKSLGFLGMRERVQTFGGRLTVTGPPGTGTTVAVEIPPVEKRKMDRDQK